MRTIIKQDFVGRRDALFQQLRCPEDGEDIGIDYPVGKALVAKWTRVRGCMICFLS